MYGYDTLSANAEDTIEHLNLEIDKYQPSKWIRLYLLWIGQYKIF